MSSSDTAMNMSSHDGEHLFDVVVNDEGQYSVWRSGTPLPAGWHKTGFRGSRDEALAHIEEVWSDITPLSIRKVRG